MRKTYAIIILAFIGHTSLAQLSPTTRLLASTTRQMTNNQLTIIDSVAYIYAPGNYYDSGLQKWGYNFGSYYANGVNEENRDTQTFHGNGRVLTYQKNNLQGTTWVPREFSRYDYSSTTLLLAKVTVDRAAPMDSTKDEYIYNSMQQIQEKRGLWWDNNSQLWVQQKRDTFCYNSNNQVAVLLQEEWDIIDNDWDSTFRFTNTYNGNQLTQQLFERYILGAWENFSMDVYSYNTNGTLAAVETMNWINSWEKGYKQNYSYTSQFEIKDMVYQAWGLSSYYNLENTEFEYNIAHWPTLERHTTWNGSTSQFEMMNGNDEIRRYYEYPLGVTNTAAQIPGDVKIYPVPATGVLYIEMNSTGNTPLFLSIVDMSGKVVKHALFAAPVNAERIIDIADLPAGNYILRITTGNTQHVQKLAITK